MDNDLTWLRQNLEKLQDLNQKLQEGSNTLPESRYRSLENHQRDRAHMLMIEMLRCIAELHKRTE